MVKNAHIRRYSRTLSDLILSLNETLFFGLDHASSVVAAWVADYNAERPHSALGYQTPAAYAAQLAAMGDPLREPETLRRSPIAPSAQPR